MADAGKSLLSPDKLRDMKGATLVLPNSKGNYPECSDGQLAWEQIIQIGGTISPEKGKHYFCIMKLYYCKVYTCTVGEVGSFIFNFRIMSIDLNFMNLLDAKVLDLEGIPL